MSAEEYVVVATQLNRVDKEGPLEPLRRGTTFTAADVTDTELKRWLGLKPAVVRTKAELEQAQQTAEGARQQIQDLQSQLAEAQAELAAARGGLQGPVTGSSVTEPAGNASADEWRAYALSVDPGNAEAINAADRNELRDKYKTS